MPVVFFTGIQWKAILLGLGFGNLMGVKVLCKHDVSTTVPTRDAGFRVRV